MLLTPAASTTRLRGYGREWAAIAAERGRAGLGAGLGAGRAKPPTGRGRGTARIPKRGRGGDTEQRAGTPAAPPSIRVRSLGLGEAAGAGGGATAGRDLGR